ncbi:hypothetical protein OSTOST_14577 [Ostertagia ostertagi]
MSKRCIEATSGAPEERSHEGGDRDGFGSAVEQSTSPFYRMRVESNIRTLLGAELSQESSKSDKRNEIEK